MTKFIYLDKSAAKEIVGSRVFQSTEFEQGCALATALRMKDFTSFQHQRLHLFISKEGTYLFGPARQNDSFLLLDLTQCDPFLIDNQLVNEHDTLTIFFRVLRFAIKVWENLRLNPSTEAMSHSTKDFLVFPFPASSRTTFRLLIAKAELPRKLNDEPQNNLLVFRSAVRDDGIVNSEPELRIFKIAADAIQYARGQSYGRAGSLSLDSGQSRRSVIEDVELHSRRTGSSPYLPFEKWKNLLTREQSQFVNRLVAGPERISGPAGSGKTLCLILKCLNNLAACQAKGQDHHSIFFTHSLATKRSILEILSSVDQYGYHSQTPTSASQSLLITTLQEYCISKLGSEIGATEFIDLDAMDSKNMQLLYIMEAYDEAMTADFATFRTFMSEDYIGYLIKTEAWSIAEMLSHEIAISIKGRASEDIHKYKKLTPIKYGLPLRCEGDSNFTFRIFTLYKEKLIKANVFDSDDIILSAMGQFNTPIWRRRRTTEGFNSIFVDETHLFNLNELSVFHFLTRNILHNAIVFSIDRSQAIGDRYATESDLSDVILTDETMKSNSNKLKNIFRYSPDIVDLAQSVTSSGATFFTNFDNPLADGKSIFNEEEMQRCKKPAYFSYVSEEQMLVGAFKQASLMVEEMETSRASVAIVAFSPELLQKVIHYSEQNRKPVELLKNRGDVEVINRAYKGGRFVVSAPDYVGGLEFDGVVLIGVDKGRVPPSGHAASIDSKTFLEYAAHNRLYVAITRARYRVVILGERSRGISKLLESAASKKLLELNEV